MTPIVDFPAAASKTCAVTYRASIAGRAEAEIRLWIAAEAATVADAWARLTALSPDVDPMSLEIEIREIHSA